MAFTWNIPTPADYTISSGTPADDILAALNTHVTANSGGGSAVWQVANYASSSPKSLLLSRKSGAAGRIILFGQNGSTANNAATRAAAQASHIYIGYSKTSTSNAPDASWLSAAPLSASDYIPGIDFMPNSSMTMHTTYAEAACGMWFLMGNTSSGFLASGAGELIQDPSSNDVSCVSGGGTTLCTAFGNSAAANGGLINPVWGNDTYTAGNAGLLVRIGSQNYLVYRATVLGSNGTELEDTANKKTWFFPVPVVCSSTYATLGVVGKFKQIAMGTSVVRDTILTDASTGLVDAFGHAYRTGTQDSAFWLVNLAI